MGPHTFSDHEEKFSLVAMITAHPYVFGLVFATLCCIATRIRTGLQASYKSVGGVSGRPRDVPVVPYWAPLLGHSVGFAVQFQNYLKSTAYKIPSGIFALKIGGGTHNIVVAPSLIKELYNRPDIPMDMESIVLRFLNLAFGDQGAFQQLEKTNPKGVWDTALILHGLMKEPFLSSGVQGTVAAVEDRTWNLVSGNPSWVDHSPWERAGQVEVVSVQPKDGSFVAEADFFGLTRDYVGSIATTLLMGHAFLENNPTFLEDLWLLDSKINILMLGLPTFMTPGVIAAKAARERLIEAVREHHRAMMDIIEGKDSGYRYSDMSDASNLVWERVRGFMKLSDEGRTYGVGDLTLLWAMNVNANQVIFWLLYFLYSQPELLEQVRNEIKPFVQLYQPDAGGLPIKEAPRLKIDIAGLTQKCPILKGAFLETMRLEVAAMSYRIVSDDFVVTESREDAAKVGKADPDKYVIKKGDIVCIPMQVHQHHPAYYRSPEKFDPRRFWVENTDEKGEKKISVEYGSMRPWGGGKVMCKGRNFAEREVLTFVAGIISVWEMEPVDKSGWKHPGHKDTTGTFVPKKDIRVRMWRRKV